MKSQDIILLLKLASLKEQEESGFSEGIDGQTEHGNPYSVRSLGSSLGISKTETGASLNRSIESGLAVKDLLSGHPKPNRQNLYEFIVYALKFVFPVKPGAPTRGLPTAFAAPMLEGKIVSASEEILVWPYARGEAKGLAVQPLFKSVPEAALNDKRLYEYLALVDALRIGKKRETNLATQQLREGLLKR